MKKIFIMFIILLFSLSVVSCKKSCKEKTNFLSEEEIRNNVNIFDITVDFNGSNYHLIKSKKGYYLEDGVNNIYVYYNKDLNKSYKVNNEAKTITLVNGNYNFSTYVENIYSVLLTRHLKSTSISKLKVREDQYLERNVDVYYSENDRVTEEYRIDKLTGACLYFHLDDGTTKIICKADTFSTNDEAINTYSQYEELENAKNLNFKEKSEIEKLFREDGVNKEYSIKLVINNQECELIKNNLGFYCSLVIDKQLITMLYDKSLDKWYVVDNKNKTKYLSDIVSNIEELENTVINLLTNHIDNVDKTYLVRKNKKFNSFDVDIYERVTASSSLMYSEEYYVDKNLGICVKKNVRLSGHQSSFELINFMTTADLSSYLSYTEIEPPYYNSWPSNHPYLEGINEIKYGKFSSCTNIEGKLQIVYKEIKPSYVDSIINNFKNNGFTLNVTDIPVFDDNQTYKTYDYIATREDGLKLQIFYNSTNEQITISLTKIN